MPQRRVSVISVVTIIATLLLVFFAMYSRIDTRIADVRSKVNESRVVFSRMLGDEHALENTLEMIHTYSIIEDLARKNFNYMKRDELRLVITNPEVLYGGVEEVPIR